MHKSNRLFWQYCKDSYPEYFAGDIKVLEYGSYNINGSVRDYFGSVQKYIGIDWRVGPGVDLVSLAHNVDLPECFDTVISASLLEHDPYWSESLDNMVMHLDYNRILILSWGAALNAEHCLLEAPDGKFHALKAELVLTKIFDLGLYIHEFSYEGSKFDVHCCRKQGQGMGEVCLIAFKNRDLAIGPQLIDKFLPEDCI
jgi:hypothetical protein